MPEGRTRSENIEGRYNPHQEIKAYKDALEAFVTSMGRLVEEWERLEFAGANVPDQGTPYPFNASFDELYHEVIAWAWDIQNAKEPSDWNVASDVTPIEASERRASKVAAAAQKAVARHRARQGK